MWSPSAWHTASPRQSFFHGPGVFEIRSDSEYKIERAQKREAGRQQERYVEPAGAIDHHAGKPRCEHSGEVAETVLETGPLTGGARAGDGLRDREEIRRVDPK